MQDLIEVMPLVGTVEPTVAPAPAAPIVIPDHPAVNYAFAALSLIGTVAGAVSSVSAFKAGKSTAPGVVAAIFSLAVGFFNVNAVVEAHRNLPAGQHFRAIPVEESNNNLP
jgi:hypothetical protein